MCFQSSLSAAMPELGVLLKNMITFKFDFDPDDFERDILNQLIDDTKKKLSLGVVRGVTVTIDRKYQMNFDGPEEEIVKVKKILDI